MPDELGKIVLVEVAKFSPDNKGQYQLFSSSFAVCACVSVYVCLFAR